MLDWIIGQRITPKQSELPVPKREEAITDSEDMLQKL